MLIFSPSESIASNLFADIFLVAFASFCQAGEKILKNQLIGEKTDNLNKSATLADCLISSLNKGPITPTVFGFLAKFFRISSIPVDPDEFWTFKNILSLDKPKTHKEIIFQDRDGSIINLKKINSDKIYVLNFCELIYFFFFFFIWIVYDLSINN